MTNLILLCGILASGIAIGAQLSTIKVISSVKAAAPIGAFPVGIGSIVELKITTESAAESVVPAVFLGAALHHDGSTSYEVYLNLANSKIYFVKSAFLRKRSIKQQTIHDLSEQVGGTCAAYAIYDLLRQTDLSGFEGTGQLQAILATEEGRTSLLASAINEYYLVTTHRYSLKGVLNTYGNRFGFKCDTFSSDSYPKVKAKILAQLERGLPMMISFNIGKNMATSPFALKVLGQPKLKMDERLWIPRKIGERTNNGHSIVAAGYFEFKGRTFLVLLDSDWSEPRVWDMDLFLNNRTALKEIQFSYCK